MTTPTPSLSRRAARGAATKLRQRLHRKAVFAESSVFGHRNHLCSPIRAMREDSRRDCKSHRDIQPLPVLRCNMQPNDILRLSGRSAYHLCAQRDRIWFWEVVWGRTRSNRIWLKPPMGFCLLHRRLGRPSQKADAVTEPLFPRGHSSAPTSAAIEHVAKELAAHSN